MLNHLLTIFLLFLSLIAAGQNGQSATQQSGWSAILPADFALDHREIHQVNDHLFYLSWNEEEAKAIRFNTDLKIAEKYSFKVNDDMAIEKVLIGPKHPSVVYTHYDREKLKFFARIQPINEKFDLKRAQEIGHAQCFSPANTGDFIFSYSPDKTHFLAFQEFPHEDGDEQVGFHVYDINLQKKWSVKTDLPMASERNKANVPHLANNGEVYLMKMVSRSGNYTYHLFKQRPEKEIEHKQISLGGLRIADVDFQLDSASNIVIAGFYAGHSYEVYQGYFYLRYNTELNEEVAINSRIPKSILTEFISKGSANKADAGLNGFYFTDMILNSENETYLLLEKEEQLSRKSGYEYNYGPIVYFHLDTAANRKHHGIIQKQQESENDHAHWDSYTCATVDRNLVLVYNDVDKKKGPVSWTYKSVLPDYPDHSPEASFKDKSGDFYIIAGVKSNVGDNLFAFLMENPETGELKVGRIKLPN